jgi:hypothetical protein
LKNALFEQSIKDSLVVFMVVPELVFVEIQLHVFFRHLMIRSNITALEKRHESVSGLGARVKQAVHHSVFVRLVLKALPADAATCRQAIGSDGAAGFNRFSRKGSERFAVESLHGNGANRASGRLRRNYHRRFALGASPMWSGPLTANIGVVHLHQAAQQGPLGWIAHGGADFVTDVPSRLVSETKVFGQLPGGDAFYHPRHGEQNLEPFNERRVRLVKDRPGRYAEDIPATTALILRARAQPINCLGAATRTSDSFAPARAPEVSAAFCFSIEQALKLKKHHFLSSV